MNEELISIIIPCYNVSKYINDLFTSIDSLNYKNKEIVFVDDGSTDNTLTLVNNFAKQRKDTKVIHQNNQGVSVARNVGIANSTGEYICFVDPDDYLSPNYLNYLYKNLKDTNSDCSACGLSFFVGKNKRIKNKNISKYKVFEGTDKLITQFYSGKHIKYQICNKLFKKIIFKKFPNYPKVFDEDCYYMEDFPLEVQYISYCNKISTIKNKLYYYRQHLGGQSHGKFTIKKISALKAYRFINALDLEAYPESQKYIKAKFCIDNLELLFRARKSHEVPKDVTTKMYQDYKNNLKYCIKCSKFPWYKKYLIPMAKPFVYLIYRRLLRNSK